MLPLSGPYSPVMSFSRVDFPVPFRPTKPVRWPGGMAAVTRSRRRRPSMRNVRSLIWSMMSGLLALAVARVTKPRYKPREILHLQKTGKEEHGPRTDLLDHQAGCDPA